MVSNKLAIVFIGVLCMLGAAGGAYIATRQNAVPASSHCGDRRTRPDGSRQSRLRRTCRCRRPKRS